MFSGARDLCRERHWRKSATAFPLVTHEPIALSVPREFRFEGSSVSRSRASVVSCPYRAITSGKTRRRASSPGTSQRVTGLRCSRSRASGMNGRTAKQVSACHDYQRAKRIRCGNARPHAGAVEAGPIRTLAKRRHGVEELKPIENDYLQRWAVSKRINSSKADSNDPTLIDAVRQAA